MSYLIYADYLPYIQADNLTAIIQGQPAIQAKAELAAQAEAISYLTQKYDTAVEFQDTSIWAKANTYKANNRVYLSGPLWVTATAYTIGQIVVENGNVYSCTTANSDVTFTIANWTLLGPQYTLYYAPYPYPLFEVKNAYKVGDKVFWKDKYYTCIVASNTPDHFDDLQAVYIQYIPQPNSFPDDPINGLTQWGTGTAYSIPANTDIANPTYWTLGDNRDQTILQKVVDIALYHLHTNIAPRNIPNHRIARYIGNADFHDGRNGAVFPSYCALGWLQACARGDVTPTLPLLPTATISSGKRIRYGGDVRNSNKI